MKMCTLLRKNCKKFDKGYIFCDVAAVESLQILSCVYY